MAGIGDYRMAVTTASPEARRYFEQAVVLAWGFNFPEAVRSFREAARRDPRCAPCYWGIAYALGPSINHDMNDREAAAAHRAAARASALAPGATSREQALIAALAKRYARDPRTGRAALDRAYADAMHALADEHAEDADVLTLAAEAAMNLHPRDYWRGDGTAQPWTPQIVAWLERALALAPGHPGANHYLIHALEDSPEPQRALAAAERLSGLAPGVGHLVHMSAHVHMRLGRYHDATLASERAIAADRAYLRATQAAPAYIDGYVRHNVHYLWASALMEGASAAAKHAAATLARGVDARSLARGGPAQHFLALPLYTSVHFGEWQAVRAAPRPPAAAPYAIGVWHYARGVAAARGGDARGARAELRALGALAQSKVQASSTHGALLGIAAALLRAEIASAEGDLASAVEHARSAVSAEDALEPGEPPVRIPPARNTLGALLLAAGRAGEAETVYRAARLPAGSGMGAR